MKKKEISMQAIIELLQKERTKTVDELKLGNQQVLPYLQQIDKALGWLKQIEDMGLETVNRYAIHRLPAMPPEKSGIYNYYHLMMDYESSDIEDWEEYKVNDSPLLLSQDDIVIEYKV